jgi:WD40 repeat protein
MQGSGASGIAFSRDSQQITTRGLDDTVRLFDIRNFKQPLQVAQNFTNYFEESNIIYSPDDRYIVTGLSVKRDQGPGKLLFLNRDTLKIEHEVAVGTGSITKILWNSRINQIMCGSSDNGTYALYDPQISIRGVLLSMSKAVKVQKDDIYFGEYVFSLLNRELTVF